MTMALLTNVVTPRLSSKSKLLIVSFQTKSLNNGTPCLKTNHFFNLSIPHADSSILHEMYNHFIKVLGRPKLGLDQHVAISNSSRKLLVKTCRILGTDNYTPMSNVTRLRNHNGKDGVFNSKLLNIRKTLVTKDTDRPVEVSFELESADKCNEVTVKDAFDLLPSSLPQEYKMDLLRIYLTTKELNSDYFIPESFVEGCKDKMQWLESLTEALNYGLERGQLLEGDIKPSAVLLQGKLQRRKKLLVMLDEAWNTSASYNIIHDLGDAIKRWLLEDRGTKQLIPLLEDLCIFMYLFAPHSADKWWRLLQDAYVCTERAGDLVNQAWPSDLAGLTWPVRITVENTSNYKLTEIKAERSWQFLESMNTESVIEWLHGLNIYNRRFNPENHKIVNVRWRAYTTCYSSEVIVTVKTREPSDMPNITAKPEITDSPNMVQPATTNLML